MFNFDLTKRDMHKLRWQNFQDVWPPPPFVNKFTSLQNKLLVSLALIVNVVYAYSQIVTQAKFEIATIWCIVYSPSK